MIREAGQMGIPSLILIGGEPFIEPRLFELVACAHESGIHGITVVTNGTIMSEGVIKKMFASNLSNLSISIDAADEAAYSKIRGENVFGKVKANIQLLNRMKKDARRWAPSVLSVCTIMDQNLEALKDVIDLCRQLELCRIIFQPVVADNTDQANPDLNSPASVPPRRHAVLDQAIDGIIRYKLANDDNYRFVANSLGHLRLIKRYFRGTVKPWEMPCYAGYNRLQVVQESKVYFCVNQNQHTSTYGDVARDSLRDLWFSEKAKSYRTIIHQCAYPCLQWCSYRDEFFDLEDMMREVRRELSNKMKSFVSRGSP
jgi:MoaA/NifB/PqqE/SkfB family radical SAM enzyme